MKLQSMLIALSILVNAQSTQEVHKDKHSSHQHIKATNANGEILSLMHTPMMQTPSTESGNVEIDFLSNMIPHHKGAILSSQALLKYTKNQELIQIAQDIITTQKQEIQEFQAIIPTLKKTKSKNYATFLKQSKEHMNEMMQQMQATTKDFEKDYIIAMIAHHQGAIKSSKQILQFSDNAKIRAIAHKIILEQEREIAQFQSLLNKK